MTINIKVMRETLERIEESPLAWDQSYWRLLKKNGRCHTTMCFAGLAVELDGCKWAAKAGKPFGDHVVSNAADRKWVKQVMRDNFDILYKDRGRQLIHVTFRAQRVLGLNSTQAAELFAGGRTLTQLRHSVERLEKEAHNAS